MRILIFLILILITSFHCSGRQDAMVFKNLTTNMGLSHGDVICICQDHTGYMWIGTADGLNKYNGIEFTVYKFNKKDSTTINNSYINSIYEDRQNNLWIGTSCGLCKYNRDNDNFERIDYNDNHNNRFAKSVTEIYEDKSNRLWIGCGRGVYLLDRENKVFNVCFEDYFYPDSLISCTGIAEDEDGFIWISFKDSKDVGLIKYNPLSGNITNHNSKDTEIRLKENSIYSLMIDNNNNVWVGYVSKGLDVINANTGIVTSYYKRPENNSISNNSIFSLALNNDGRILIGTNGGGLNIFDPGTGLFSYYKALEPEGSLLSNAIQTIFVGDDGMIWLGCRAGGISIYDNRFYKFTHYRHEKHNINSLSGNSVTCFTQDLNGNIWIATDGGGISFFDPSERRFVIYRSDSKNHGTLTNDKVLAIETDNRGGLWAGMWQGGLDYFQIDGDKLRLKKKYSYINESVPGSHSVFNIYCDRNDRLWVGTLAGAYLSDRRKDTFEPVILEDLTGRTTYYIIRDILIDSNNDVWLATQLNGLIKINLKTGEKEIMEVNPDDNTGMISSSINVIYEDAKKRLWIGTDEDGLSLYDRQKDTFIYYTTEQGLPSNAIVGILEDDHGNLWISSNDGLTRASIDTVNGSLKLEFRNYDVQDGLQSKVFNRWAFFKSNTGEMYFGGINGFNVFHPDSIKDNSAVPPVEITDFLVFNKPVAIGAKDSPLKKHISQTDTLVLNYDQSLFTFRFVALNYIYGEKSQYAYMLEGFDKDWNYIGTERRATYTNLDPGEYLFKVKASNNDGVWNETGSSIHIVILPPWWKTLLFRIILVVFLLAGSVTFYRVRLNKLKKEQQDLESKIKERTMELSEANALLEERKEEITLQNEELSRHRNHLEQLVQERTTELEAARVKAEESDRLKSAFLANMSHEIRTPMNAIVGFSTLISEEDITTGERKEYSDIIKDNSDTLLVLINDIIEISLIEANQLRINKSNFDASAILLQLENYFSLKNNRDIDLNYVNKKDELKLVLNNDPTRFRQVFSNLLNNAFKYTESGNIWFGFEIQDDQVQFFVSDTGIGIASSDFKNIFNYFHKLEKEDSKLNPGAGIGLSLSSKLIELMGGNIWLESEEGEGSTFYFTLPYSVENVTVSPKGEKETRRIYKLEKMKIVVAEDEPNNYKLIEKILQPTGAEIIWARNGREAVDFVSKNPGIRNCLILMDIKMPVMNGIEANEEIKKINRHIPIIAVTAYAYAQDKTKIMQHDFKDYIVKPLQPQRLIESIKRFI
jgi:signal transduction histidine kinase/ligand-binding sensor domain-containing protein/CheY-like chemotaxis protein